MQSGTKTNDCFRGLSVHRDARSTDGLTCNKNLQVTSKVLVRNAELGKSVIGIFFIPHSVGVANYLLWSTDLQPIIWPLQGKIL
jgi:hypothetical protein